MLKTWLFYLTALLSGIVFVICVTKTPITPPLATWLLLTSSLLITAEVATQLTKVTPLGPRLLGLVILALVLAALVTTQAMLIISVIFAIQFLAHYPPLALKRWRFFAQIPATIQAGGLFLLGIHLVTKSLGPAAFLAFFLCQLVILIGQTLTQDFAPQTHHSTIKIYSKLFLLIIFFLTCFITYWSIWQVLPP